MAAKWNVQSVQALQEAGIVLVEDGNHGEYRPRPDEFSADGTAFIRAADLHGGHVAFSSASRINAVARARIRKGIGQPGDIILSHKGTVGKLAMAPLHCEPYICSPQTTFWRVLDETILNRRFLYYFMHSSLFAQQLDAVKGETDMADYVSLTAQRRLQVPIPPMGEQDNIASVLGALDDKIDLNRRMNETLEAMARAIFKDWFVDFSPTRAKMEGRPPYLAPDLWALFPDRLDDEGKPEGWEVDKLGTHVLNFDARRIPLSGSERSKRRGAIPYHGATGVMDHVDAHLFEGIHVLVGEDGSVAKSDGTAFTQYVWGKFWVNNHAHVLQGKGAVSAEYLLLYFSFELVEPYVTGAVQAKLSQGRMNGMPFLNPGDPLLSAFSEQVQPYFSRLRHNVDESKTLTALRDVLLPKLMSGEVRVRDAENLLGAVA
jgi:type I restriction enzyme S subunit